MTKKTSILIILAGCAFFGIAMGIRDGVEGIWLRAVVAGVGGLGLGLAVGLVQQKCQPKRK